MPRSTRTSPGELAILGSGVVVVVSSFLDFYTAGPFGVNAWANGFVPLTTLPVFFVALMAAEVAMVRLAHFDITSRPFGFTWDQIHLVLGFFATVVVVAYLLQARPIGRHLGIGFWGIAIGSVVALVGAVVLSREHRGY